MADPITAAITVYVAKNAPHWLADLRDTLLDKGKQTAIDKGKAVLSDREQQGSLKRVLKQAVSRGLAQFSDQHKRDQYREILTNLSEPGEHSSTLRREAMALFTLTDTPDLNELNEVYNRSLRTRNLSQPTPPAPVDAAPYLGAFFNALLHELYADPHFKDEIKATVLTRMALTVPQSLTEANNTLHQIHHTLQGFQSDYTEEQFQRDIDDYTEYIERSLHNLKIVGFLPKELKRDPELHGIFVPLRVALKDQPGAEDKQDTTLVTMLERNPYLVLLGDPGSGKSTAIKHLAWSHAHDYLPGISLMELPLLPNHPVPLRIELRLLAQERKRHPYSFLDYVTDVLLGRNNIKINPLLFERLLAQKRMLLLFDGLDEVPTLHERKSLVEEIEHFAQHYPGNSILITSRPVGYDLARCNERLFTHAHVLGFNDEQIHQFLEHWYTHYLHLSPLSYEDHQELETLFKTLKENPRLHKLAENPLLLTVLTGLYRSQRLPEKRVQVYERCAELLLETWARLKGTDERWKDLKLSKEDQEACVAHLGFKLHVRSQELAEKQQPDEDTATDVPARFLLHEIEHFLEDRKLISEKADQRKQAKLFLDLMQIEAGLIVERGTDENGENLYGFVHRTFQEYFAASDVHERYKQTEELAVIDDFLVAHLHDPHWREVIFLLFGKLGRSPVTRRLQQILTGKIHSRRSYATEILQQDLFFVADCLIEEIPVELDLVIQVISRLSNLILVSPFKPQQEQALGRLGRLIQTKQCSSLASQELLRLLKLDTVTDIDLKVAIAETLYNDSSEGSQEEQEAVKVLVDIVQSTDLSVNQTIHACRALYRSNSQYSEERQQARQTLITLMKLPNVATEQQIEATEALYQLHMQSQKERREAFQICVQFMQRPDLSVEQQIQVARNLYWSTFTEDSEERREAFQLCVQLIQRPDLTVEQQIQAIYALCPYIPEDSEEQREVFQIWVQFIQRPDLTVEQQIKVANTLYIYVHKDSDKQREVIQLLVKLLHSPDLTVEQQIKVTHTLYSYTPEDSDERREVIQLLVKLLHRSDLTVEQQIQVANILYNSSSKDSQERREAVQMFVNLTHYHDLTIDQVIKVVTAFYRLTVYNFEDLQEHRQKAVQMFWQLVQDTHVSIEQRLESCTVPIMNHVTSYRDKLKALEILKNLLPVEQITNYVKKLYIPLYRAVKYSEISSVIKILQMDWLPSGTRSEIYDRLCDAIPQFDKIPAPDDQTT